MRIILICWINKKMQSDILAVYIFIDEKTMRDFKLVKK